MEIGGPKFEVTGQLDQQGFINIGSQRATVSDPTLPFTLELPAGTYDVVHMDVIWPAEFASKGLITNVTKQFPASWKSEMLGGALLKIAINGDYLRYVKPSQQPWVIAGGAVMLSAAVLQ